jgi:DNA invertase Pin-like site-specific DNA recombinase
MNKYIAYYRVSTKRQGLSGLGLDAQKDMVKSYITQHGGVVVDEFIEVESGKNNNRQALKEAISKCELTGSILIIAKLDRLARNVYFISQLMEKDIEFIACDLPQANRFTIHILAAVAENEAKAISERTKAALAQKKKRGEPLGVKGIENLKNVDEVKRINRLKEAKKEKADEYARKLASIIIAKRKTGETYAAIAAYLQEQGINTRRGGKWYPATVRRLLNRLNYL